MKKTLLACIVLLLVLAAQAQDRREAWLRVNVTHWYAKKRGWGLEFHQRMQSNYLAADNNIFSYPLLTIIRPWLYWRTPKNWTWAYSPLSYHGYTKLVNAQGKRDTYTELRTTVGLQRGFTFGAITNRNRAWYEFRFIDIGSNAFTFGTRLRIQNVFIIPLFKLSKNNQLGYQLSNEVFIAQQRSSVAFDHNRFYNALQWRAGKQEINLGYQWSLHKSGATYYDRRQLFLNMNLDL